MLGNAILMHVAPSKYNLDKRAFVGTEMSAFSQTSAIVLGVGTQKYIARRYDGPIIDNSW